MSVFFCDGCNQYVDSDKEDCGFNPFTEEELCSSCFESWMEDQYELADNMRKEAKCI